MEKKDTEFVILVDNDDKEIGILEKMDAHRQGLLHRALSVFVFNSKNELLLQQRAKSKYHSGGLWTNTCCSHPRQFEQTIDAANRRLFEEMGMKCELEFSYHFIYKALLDKGLTEHELDHVFVAYSDELPKINPLEVEDYKYISLDLLQDDLLKNPEKYTEWFKIIFKNIENKLLKK